MLLSSDTQHKKDNGHKVQVGRFRLDVTCFFFSVESSAALQLALSLAVGSPSSQVSDVLSDPTHSQLSFQLDSS